MRRKGVSNKVGLDSDRSHTGSHRSNLRDGFLKESREMQEESLRDLGMYEDKKFGPFVGFNRRITRRNIEFSFI